jgi:AcrR family transcriptional regulator
MEGEAQPSLKRGRGRPRREGADAEILGVALSLLQERGYHDFTVEDVAERAGTAKTTIYRRFPTKAALVVAALTPGSTAHVPAPNSGSVQADLARILHEVIALLRGAGDAQNEPELAAAMRAAVAPDRNRILDVLSRIRLRTDATLLADLLLGALLLGRREVEAIVETVLRGAI